MVGVIFSIAFTFCYFLLFDCLLVDLCLLFLFSCFLDSSLSSQESILTGLLFFWLILKLYHFHYGSITSYCSILLNCSRLLYLILSWLLFSIAFIMLFLFSFYFSISFTFTLQILFDLVLHLLFYLVFALLYLLSFYIIMYPA